MNFTQNLKAFVSPFPLREMSGHQKFVVVAANLVKGDINAETRTSDVKANWRKSLLQGKYNPAYYDRATRAGWVEPVAGKRNFFSVTEAGINNLEGLVPEFTAGELKKAGSLVIVNWRGTHAIDKYLRTIFATAKRQVLIADSHVDGTIFDTVLDSIPQDCPLKLLYSKAYDGFEERAKRFGRQYMRFTHRRYKRLHDRFMIVDDIGYMVGPSIKDAGKDSPALVVSLGGKERAALQMFFDDLWGKARSK